VQDEAIEVDFTGTAPLTAGPINYPVAGTCSAVYWAMKFFLDPEGPANAGMYRPFQIHIPKGTFIHAEWPAPVYNGNLSTSERICDVIWQALAQAMPERMVGLPYGDCNGTSVSGRDPRTGVPYVLGDLPPGGWGATSAHDGMDATYDRHGNCMDITPERAEIIYPVLIERRELIRDSGGPGKFRGGLSVRETFRPVGHEAIIGCETSRTKDGPPGVFGGKPGRPGRTLRNYGEPHEEVLGGRAEDGTWRMCTFSNRPLRAGESYTNEAAGGGGWGDPLERDPQLVLADYLDDLISLESAEREYGVVIDAETCQVNISATQCLRDRHKKVHTEKR
jgi:N-methylhydantoinase B